MGHYSDVKADFNDFYRRANESWQPFVRNANIALKAYAGSTWQPTEVHNLAKQGRTPQEFNITRPKVEFFSGYMRDNIKGISIAPNEPSDQRNADDMDEVFRIVADRGNENYIFLNGFDDCLKTGMSLCGISKTFDYDPINGDIQYWKRSYNSFYIDPNFERFDLRDASEVVLRDFVTKERAKQLLPFIDPEEIEQIASFSSDNKFELLNPLNSLAQQKGLISYDSYYRWTTRTQEMITNENTGVSRWVSEDPEERERQITEMEVANYLAAQTGSQERFRLIKQDIPTVELNILLTGEPVYSGRDPLGLDEYPFAPQFCFFEPQLADYGIKVQGVALGLVDLQRSLNRRMIRSDDVMDSAINQGYFYKPGSVSVQDMMQAGSTRFVPVQDDADLNNDIRDIRQGQVPQGWQQQSQLLLEMSNLVSGVNESLIGVDEGGNSQISGRLAEVRAANGVRANRVIFDNFERFQRTMGIKTLKAIQLNYPKGKIERMLNREVEDSFFAIENDRFDVTVKQAVLSQTQRDSFYFELLRLREVLGDVIDPNLIIENLPMAGASKVQDSVRQRQEAAQQAEQAQQEQAARNARLQDSITDQNLAMAQERRAKVLDELASAGERRTQQRENSAKAQLDLVKAVETLQSMRQERVESVIELINKLKQSDAVDDEEQLIADMQTASQLNPPAPQAQEATPIEAELDL